MEVKKMSENPRIYPFKRAGDEVINDIPRNDIPRKVKGKLKIMPLSAERVIRPALIAFAAFLLARAQILGGLYPFATAFLAAAAIIYPKKGVVYVLPVLLGLASALSGVQFFTYAAVVSIISFIFLFYSVDTKKQWYVVPGMVVAVVLVSKGLVISIAGFDNYLFLVSIFESILTGALSMVFMVILSALHRFDVSRRFAMEETICIFIASMGIISGMSGWILFGIDIQSVASRFLIIAVAYLGGGGAGAAIGAMVGIVPSISEVIAPSVIATYAFSGLLAGVFSNFGRLGTLLGFILGNLILALYVLTGAQISSALIASMLAGVIFLIIPKKIYRNLSKAFSVTGIKSAREEKSERLLRLAIRRLRNVSWIFHDLGASLVKLTEADTFTDEEHSKAALDQLSRQLCRKCSLNDICWEMDYSQTYNGIIGLFEVVRDSGEAHVTDMPDHFAKRCPHLKELLAIINCIYDMYCQSKYWYFQRQNSRILLSRQLEGVSEVLEKVSREITDYGEERELLERELQRAIAKRGMPVDNAGIFTITEKSIDLWAQYAECPGEILCRQAMEDEVSRLLGYDFTVHEKHCGGNNCLERCSYRLLIRGAHVLNIGKAQLAKDHREVCGDTGSSLLLDAGKQLLMISDGMGAGAKAAAESETALNLVSRLLEVGFNQETAIDTVNGALSLRGNEECFVTLDLCVVDLYNGKADFIKSGSSASFIKRGHTVKMIQSSSLPVGMLYNVEKEIINENVLPGDMIILASDGLLESDTQNNAQWLSRVLEQVHTDDPQDLAEYLLEKVISVSNGRIKDDITVLVAQLGNIA
jgi:stage II sporulation protein E